MAAWGHCPPHIELQGSRVSPQVLEQKDMRGSKGFSLFELSSVLLVMLALSAVTVPGMYSIYNAYKLSSTTQAISATLQNARARAMRENRPISIIFNSRLRQFGIDENGDS